MKKRLTTASVRSIIRQGPPEGTRQLLVQDSDTRGLGLRVSKTAASYVFQRSVRGRSKRVTIGDAQSWTLDDARKEARRLTVQVDSGEGLDAAQRPETVTLADAIEMHIKQLRAKGGSERTASDTYEEFDRHCRDWLQRPIVEIKASDCSQRHEKITKNSGPAVANRIMRGVRAIHNTAGRRFDDWPRNPTRAVAWNRIPRRREPIPWDKLPAWFEAVHALSNPIRRDYQLVVLFTGLRRNDAATIRWEHIDFEAGTLHRPTPKGGEDRAFTVPLASEVLRILRARHDLGANDGGWTFPGRRLARQPVKPIRHPAEKHLPSPHRLRDTFASACLEARIGSFETKLLLNHALPSADVTDGYMRPSVEHVRDCVESVVSFLTKHCPTDTIASDSVSGRTDVGDCVQSQSVA
ncbi:MAG: integrase family protein [Planctomycetota bacterium]